MTEREPDGSVRTVVVRSELGSVMLQAAKRAVRSKANALAARVTEIVDGAADAVRAAALGLGVIPAPVPVPVRVRAGRSHRER